MTPEGLTTHAPVERPTKPFPGLRPFEFSENQLFFGRDGQSDQIIRKLSATRFVAVVGTSGSGKSSLVRAGLLPDLFSGFMQGAGSHWRVALMRPGNDPLGALARALNTTDVFGSDDEENAALQTVITEATLRRGSLGLVEAVRQNRMPSGESLLVVVDQFEELFRFARVTASGEQYRYEAAAFVKLLLEASRQREQNVYVVLTMRSDFLGDCSIFWDLPEAINEGQYLVPRMTRDQRAEAITGPVAVCGGRVEQRLVNRLLNDMGDNPDLLPILQHALMRTWENWLGDHAEGEALDLRHYEAVGTMTDALSLHADEAFNELPDDRARLIAEKIFKALTEKGEDNREVRRPVVLGDLCAVAGASLAEVVAVLEVFRREGRSFLTPSASNRLDEESLIDISHESLIRNWGRLKTWVDEESGCAKIYRRLADTAVLYERGQAGLWRDPDLQHALEWRGKNVPNAAWATRYHPAFDPAVKFLDASVQARDAAVLEDERRRRREVRRTRVAALIFFLLFMLSLAALVYANVQKTRAEDALNQVKAAQKDTEAALLQAKAEKGRAEEAKAQADEQAGLALLSKKTAEEAKDEAQKKRKEAEASNAAALKSAADARRSETAANAAKNVAESKTKEAEEARAEAEKRKTEADAAAERSRQLLYASDMNLAEQAYESGGIARARALLDSHSALRGDSPGFDWYYLWGLLHDETEAFEVSEKDDSAGVAALAGDGNTLAVAKVGRIELWDVAAGKRLRSVETDKNQRIDELAVSHDGSLLAYSFWLSPTVQLTNTATSESFRLSSQGWVSDIAFSYDGMTLAIGHHDGGPTEKPQLELWDVKTRRPMAEFDHKIGVLSIAFSPDGSAVAAGGPAGEVRVWDVKSKARLCDLAGTGRGIGALVFSPDGRLLAAGDAGGSVHVIRMSYCGKVLYKLDGPAEVYDAAFSRDGSRLTVSYYDKSIRAWDISSLESIIVSKNEWNSYHLAYLADGRLMTYSYGGGVVRLWDVEARIRERWLTQTYDPLYDVAFSPDGRLLAAVSRRDSAVLVWDAVTHEFKKELRLLDLGDNIVHFKWAGQALATTVPHESRPRLWDARSFTELPPLRDAGGIVSLIDVSPDGKRLVASRLDKAIIWLWDVGSKKLLKSVTLGRVVVSSLAVSPDGSRIAAGLGDGTVKVWDGSLAGEALTLRNSREDASPISALAFSPDGRMLVAGFGGGYLQSWDARTGEQLFAPYAHAGKVTSVTFSADGRTIATGGDDDTVKLWSSSTFKQLLTLRGHRSGVTSVAFSPDGRTLASADGRGVVRFWRAAGEAEVKARAKEKEKDK